jgi:RND family efflux transporter MFP subunit
VREAALTVTVVELEPVELARNLALNGAIHAWQEVIVAPEVGGFRVAEVHVEVGDSITVGQTLVTLSTALLNAELATRQALLKQREAELMNAEAALRRGSSLSAMDVLAEADLDRLRSEALASEARLESAKADLETSQLRLEFARVAAPDDGVITSRTVTVGQIAQAGTEMLRLLRQGRVEWRGEVPEALLADLAAGQAVTVTTADGTKLHGRVRVVAPTIVSANRTGLVYVDLETNPNVRPGMFARGAVEIGRSPALMVPLESVVSADGYSYVFVLGGDDDTVTRQRIETGAVFESEIEVVSGLRSGEVIVEKGAGFLKDGDRVNVARASGS